MFSKKEKALLYQLVQAKGKFVTSQFLADKLNCSDRSIRTYIKSIQEELKHESVMLESKQGTGYRLIFENKEDYGTFLLKNGLVERSSEQLTADREERFDVILNRLLFDQKGIYLDDLADDLYVSRSTLSHDMKGIRQLLANFDLFIESKPNKGMYVVGSERHKRRFIMNYFFGGRFRRTIYDYLDHLSLPETLTLDTLTLIVLEECREAQLRLSDFIIQNLVIHIGLAIQRLVNGFTIAPIHLEGGDFKKESQVAKHILSRIEEVVQIDFPQEEVNYITLHLFSKEAIASQKGANRDRLQIELRQTLDELGLDDIYHFSNDHQFMEGIILHLETLDIRLKNAVHLENPMKDSIYEQYPDMYFLTEEVLKHLPSFAHKELSVDEIAYVTLHFMASIERLKDHNRMRVLVICSTGYGSAQMLRNRLKNEFGNCIEITDVIGYYDITDDKIEDVDLILSTIDLSHLAFKVPALTVSVFLKATEVQSIKQRLKELKPHRRLLPVEVPSAHNDQLYLEGYFDARAFLIAESMSKESLLSELVGIIAKEEEQDFQKEMLSLIQQREEMSSVIFSNKIAVPHPTRALAKYHRVAVAIIKNGVAWDDRHPAVQLVFLLSPSVCGNSNLTKITRKIVTLTEREDIQEQLLQVNDFQEFITIFKGLE